MIESLAIVGLGLMGGSLGLAAKARGVASRVVAYSRSASSREEALAGGVVDEVFETPGDAVAGADLVVLCTPVLTMPELAQSIRDRLSDGCIVTDVGSTKGFLVRELGQVFTDCPAVFVGSHPMAGSEKTGVDAARADLYDGARVIVTRESEESSDAAERVAAFWKALGAEVSVMTPQEHDTIIARTSHLPHMVAAALVAAIDRDEQDVGPFCGPGFRCTTRVAEGSEHVWHDIVKTNLDAIRAEIDAFCGALEGLRDLLEGEDLEKVRSYLAECRAKRTRLGYVCSATEDSKDATGQH